MCAQLNMKVITRHNLAVTFGKPGSDPGLLKLPKSQAEELSIVSITLEQVGINSPAANHPFVGPR